jgi:N-acetyl-gamma-glutamyl-phosphate reductase
VNKVNIGIVGGTGYSGVELVRILAGHPQVHVQAISSRGSAGQRVDELFPSLRGHTDLVYTAPGDTSLVDCDLVFFATPNGVAMKSVPDLIKTGVRVIDFSADFRLDDAVEWSQWYGMQHSCPELLHESVYGLPEVNRMAVREARIVANPGCYPTAVQLGFLPLLESKVIDCSRLIADAVSGVSGAGRGANVEMLLCETAENLKAYAASGHRHQPEIVQGLRQFAGNPVDLTFVAHLAPMIRGIHATLYAELTEDLDVQALFEKRFADEPFVDVMPPGSHPETRSVRGANICRIAIHRPGVGNRVVVLVVVDNLVKGAAGQAVQNMNIMLGFEESAGLSTAPLAP